MSDVRALVSVKTVRDISNGVIPNCAEDFEKSALEYIDFTRGVSVHLWPVFIKDSYCKPRYTFNGTSCQIPFLTIISTDNSLMESLTYTVALETQREITISLNLHSQETGSS